MQSADWMALASLVVASASLGVSYYAIRKSDINASAAMLVTLSEAFRSAWDRVLEAIKTNRENPSTEDTRYKAFSELLNIFEVACAIINERSIAGFSKRMIHQYLVESLGLIVVNDYAKGQIPKMLTDETTFEHIKAFIKSLRNQPLRYIIPIEWYEL